MHRSTFFVFLSFCLLALVPTAVRADGLVSSTTHFYYRSSASGQIVGASIIHKYYPQPLRHASASVDPRIDPTLVRAATIAQERSSARTKARCWRYVKQALYDAGAVGSYPTTNYACQAGEELSRKFGFSKLSIRDPYAAPVGAVIVYGRGSGSAGHVELRTKDGFVSDYHSKNRCFYPVVGIYEKFSS